MLMCYLYEYRQLKQIFSNYRYDAGDYICTAHNGVGYPVRNVVRLSVKCKLLQKVYMFILFDITF